MAGIQISGLLSNQAFDWKSVVDQLVQADSAPITKLQGDKTTNGDKTTALATINTALTAVQDSVQAIRSGDLFSSRNVSSDTAGTTWNSNSANGAAIGSYTFAVSQLATNAQTTGAADIGAGLGTTTDLSVTTLANLNIATPITAGTFSVNGKPVTVATTDSMADVFAKISTATGGAVTGTYDPSSDGIKLTSTSGELVLGAANDTSNFLASMKLSNNGTDVATSSAPLGTVKTFSPLVSAGLRSAITGVDPLGNGTFNVNGVAIAYNINSDSLASVVDRINKSSAGVSARYDSANDRMVIVNQKTGDSGIGLDESGSGFLAAVGLTTGATFTHGKNALFTLNGGPVLSSMSNTLDSSTHGIAGLSVTVNTKATQTVNVQSDIGTMQTSIQDFLTKFNSAQDAIAAATKITVSGGKVSTSVLSDNHEVDGWASKLQSLAFESVSGLTGSVKRLDDLGIDFDSTTGHLTLKNTDKLTTALSTKPDDVKAFFLTPSTGFVSKMYSFVTDANSTNLSEQSNLTKSSTDIDTQIATIQSRLDNERQQLTASFITMLDAQSAAQSQSSYLTNQFFKGSSG